MKEEKIFYLFSFYDHFRTEFKMLGSDLISHVWMDEEHLLWCYNDDVNCVESERNPEGM
jgi:alpha-1,3(6)-mannosylglycoprotein beta-1,6-N-acetyl-glucosaminyltransferase